MRSARDGEWRENREGGFKRQKKTVGDGRLCPRPIITLPTTPPLFNLVNGHCDGVCLCCVCWTSAAAGEVWVGRNAGEGAGVPGEQADAPYRETAGWSRQQAGHAWTGLANQPRFTLCLCFQHRHSAKLTVPSVYWYWFTQLEWREQCWLLAPSIKSAMQRVPVDLVVVWHSGSIVGLDQRG